MPTDKKDYIFNLRLSRETVDKLRSRAVENGQTASQLARTMIKDGLEVFGDISEDLFGSTATKKSEKKKNEVVYYYDAILAHDTECADTGKKLKKGQKVIIGENRRGEKYYFHPGVFSN